MEHKFYRITPFASMKVNEKGEIRAVKSDISVMATVTHKSGKKSTSRFVLTKATRGVNKHEIALEIKQSLNNSGLLDKAVRVLVK